MKPRPAGVWSGLFVLALVLRLVVVHQYGAGHPLAERLVIDEAAYDGWAQRIAAGELVSPSAFFQEPLYSYGLGLLYALCGRSLLLVRVLQALLGAATAVLLGGIAGRVFGRGAGYATAFAAAVDLPLLLFPALLLKPVLFLGLVGLLLAALMWADGGVDDRRWLLVGLLAGLAALVRGNLFVLGPLIALWPLGRALRENQSVAAAARASAFAWAAWLLALAPACLHNGWVANVWLPTSGAGTNFAIGNALENPWGRPGELDFVRGIPEYEPLDWQREAERRSGRALGPGEVSRYWMAESLRSFRAEPWAHARQLARKLALALSAYEVPDNHHLGWDAQYVPLLRWPLGGFGLWGALGLAGLLARAGRRAPAPRGSGLLAAFFLGYLATIVLTMTSMRIRLGLLPALLCFAGDWLARVWSLRAPAPNRRREALRLALALLLALAVVHAPIVDRETREEDWLARDYNLAVTLERAGEWREARALVERLERERPGSPRVAILRASCAWDEAATATAEGREADAQRLLAEAAGELAALSRERLAARDAHQLDALAGRIAYARGAWSESRAALIRALAFVPEEAELALLALRAGRREAAAASASARPQRLSELEAEAQRVQGVASSASERGLLAVELSELELERARALLEAGEGAGKAAEGLRARALERLRGLAEDEGAPVEVRIEARLSAAGAQLYLGRVDSAERHLRAALALDPSQQRARELLARIEAGR